MVVAPDRMSAATWSHKMNEYIAKRGYDDMTTLVAFSGSLKYGDGDDAVEVTEASMNGVRDTALHFRENDDAKVLIVANKFQTGFDEPRLCAMYVDRKLSGVQAVHTLSRLNRVFPGKPKQMVVDFVNETSAILESFKPYYRGAHIEDEIPANALADLGDTLDAAAFYTSEELDKLADAYIAREDFEPCRSWSHRCVADGTATCVMPGSNKTKRPTRKASRFELTSSSTPMPGSF